MCIQKYQMSCCLYVVNLYSADVEINSLGTETLMESFASRSLCCYNLIKLVYIVTNLCSKQIKQFKICMTVSVFITRKSVSCKNELNVVDFTASDYSDGVFKHFWCLMLGIVCIVPLVRPDKHKMQIAEFSFKCVVRNLSVLFSNSYAISICKITPPFMFYGNLHDRNGMVCFFVVIYMDDCH